MTRNIQSQHVNCGRRHLSQCQYCMSELHKHAGVPRRLRRCCDARRRAVGPARVIFFLSHPLNDMHTEWISTGHPDMRGDPHSCEDGSAFLRIENADGSSRSQGSSIVSCSLQTAAHKDCTSVNSACEIPSLPWKGLGRVYQQTYIILFCSLLERLWKRSVPVLRLLVFLKQWTLKC